MDGPRRFEFARYGVDRGEVAYDWEWRLGSTLYVVWTQNRTNDANPGEFELGRDVDRLFGAPPDDIFLVKFSYRIGR